jgi:hypothetical protein
MTLLTRWSVAFISLIAVGSSFAEPNFNLGDEKVAARTYHDSGQYMREIAGLIVSEECYFDQRLNQVSAEDRKKIAIVYDIDETSLSNYKVMADNDFDGTLSRVKEHQEEAIAEPIAPVLELYRYAQSRGVSEFFITGRHEDLRAATIKNLHSAGYENWQGLYLEPNNAKYKTAADFKAQMRKKLTDMGYHIVLSIGDQCSDLATSHFVPPNHPIPLPSVCGAQLGDYEERAVKLPNPYYHVP